MENLDEMLEGFVQKYTEGFPNEYGQVDSYTDLEDFSDEEFSNILNILRPEEEITDFEIDPLSLVDEESDEEDVATLESVNMLKEIEEMEAIEIQYPSLFIKGVGFEQEFTFLQQRQFTDDALPLYIQAGSLVRQVGMMDLTLDSLLLIHSVPSWSLQLYLSEEECYDIDDNSPSDLLRFIKL